MASDKARLDEATERRLESFFKNPERCRQQYMEAWKLGKLAHDALTEARERIEALEEDNVKLSYGILAEGTMREDSEATITSLRSKVEGLVGAANDAEGTLNRAFSHFDGTSLERWAIDFSRCAGRIGKALRKAKEKNDG